MPFSEDFVPIYSQFIRVTLEEAGYAVSRADDILSQQSILKDVVRGIGDASLVVADLTGANANVYYELGLAHALGKKVLLLIQDVSELPFDLQAYRVIQYDVHFAAIGDARKRLLETAQAAREGGVPFGNPVKDFLGAVSAGEPAARPPATGEMGLERNAPGLLDQFISIEDGFETISALVAEINQQTTEVGEFTNRVGENLTRLMNAGRPQLRQARAVVIGLAQRLDGFEAFLSDRNEQYGAILTDMHDALESVIAVQQLSSAEEHSRLNRFLGVLETTKDHATTARGAIAALATSIRTTPRMERSYNRAADATAKQLDRYADNLDQTVSMLVRAIEVGRAKSGAA